MQSIKGPVYWQGQTAKLMNTGGLEFKNGVKYNTYLTIAEAKAATPSGPEIAYVEAKEALYLYCDSCAFDADDDMVLTTGNGGNTRWELLQKLSRALGDTGWIDSDNATISALNTTDVRLAISSQAAIGIKGSRIPVPIGNYDITITGAAGLKFVHFDDDTLVLKQRNDLWDFDAEVPVAIVYWNGTAIVAAPQTEFHGIRDNIWHKYAHTYYGLQYNSGLTFTGSVQTDNNVNPGASETVYNLWSTSGVVQDEDFKSTPGTGQWSQTLGTGLAAADAGKFNFMYYNGTVTTTVTAMSDNAPFIHAGANTPPQWNSGGTLTAAITGDYIVYHYFATPMVGGWSVFARPHNAKFTSLAAALAARPSQLTWTNYAELKHLYTAIFRVNTGWANSHRCKLVSLNDYRTQAGTPVAATVATSHASLSSLELAGSGVTWGHVDDQAQTIAGVKTFSSGVKLPAVPSSDTTFFGGDFSVQTLTPADSAWRATSALITLGVGKWLITCTVSQAATVSDKAEIALATNGSNDNTGTLAGLDLTLSLSAGGSAGTGYSSFLAAKVVTLASETTLYGKFYLASPSGGTGTVTFRGEATRLTGS